MNKFFTQIALGTALLFANVANAQVNQNFNSGVESLKLNCWKFNNMVDVAFTNGNGMANPIEGTYSVRQDAAILTGEISTPFYNISTPLNISFTYKLAKKLDNGATRLIQVGTTDRNGVFTPNSTSISLNQNSAVQNGNNFLTYNGTINANGVYRLTIRITGTSSDGNAYVYFDGLNIRPTDATNTTFVPHYSSYCNAETVANDDVYSTSGYTSQFYSKSVLQNDTDADIDVDGALTASVATQSADGNVIMASDGTFTFKPNEVFSGTSTTFTYQVYDNGHEAYTKTAVVTINFTEEAPVVILPIHFMSFAGNANGNKAQLTWSVAENETGSHFEVERSTDGKKYISVATVMTSTSVGAEKYEYTDAAFVSSGSFYRVKAINKDGSSSYSKIVFIKGSTTVDNKLTLMQNPVQSTLNFSFNSGIDETAEVAIFNLAGVKMHSQKVTARKGTNSISLGMDSRFNKGAYILTVQSASASKSVQLIKQ